MRNLILCPIIMAVLAACTVTPSKPADPVDPPAQVIEAPTDSEEPLLGDWPNESWSAVAFKAFSADPKLLAVVPADMPGLCKNFPAMSPKDRAKVYTYLISAMARFESSFKPSTTYQEDFDDAKGQPVISAGLLQISIESAKSYGCPVKVTEDLFSPTSNINCGERILSRWIQNDGVLSGRKWITKSDGTKKNQHLGGGRYWSVLRETSGSRAKIFAKLKALPLCG